MSVLLTQILGWVGMILIVLAYFLVSFKKVDTDSRLYQYLNLIGAVTIGVHVFYQRAWPALVLEIIWSLIAITALIKLKGKS